MKILMIDNYDSFTYNLVHYVKENEGVSIDVVRNDKIDFDSIKSYDKVMLSPGPGIPSEAGDLMKVIEFCDQNNIPMLGVCLGHQALAEYFGGTIENMSDVFHGLAHSMKVEGEDEIYKGLPSEFKVGRYHSWQVVDNDAIKKEFNITARDLNGAVLGMRHQSKAIHGLQYHPESVLTEHGKEIVRNWLKA